MFLFASGQEHNFIRLHRIMMVIVIIVAIVATSVIIIMKHGSMYRGCRPPPTLPTQPSSVGKARSFGEFQKESQQVFIKTTLRLDRPIYIIDSSNMPQNASVTSLGENTASHHPFWESRSTLPQPHPSFVTILINIQPVH